MTYSFVTKEPTLTVIVSECLLSADGKEAWSRRPKIYRSLQDGKSCDMLLDFYKRETGKFVPTYLITYLRTYLLLGAETFLRS